MLIRNEKVVALHSHFLFIKIEIHQSVISFHLLSRLSFEWKVKGETGRITTVIPFSSIEFLKYYKQKQETRIY